jgi:glucose/arabinose dehydrogenase
MADLLLSAIVCLAFVAACGPASSPAPGTLAPTGAHPTSTSRSITASPSTAPEQSPTQTVGQPPTQTPSQTVGESTTPGSPGATNQLSIELLAQGLPALTFLANAGDGSGLLYAVGQGGDISAVSSDGDVQAEPFLDISERISAGGEQGLLGLAFHPDYESNGRFFVNYTDLRGDTVISEFARSDASAGMVLADAGSERILLTIDQPYANHNGGMIAFGPDGYLYIGMGDGGSGGDPLGNGQSPRALLGKMLRIDVDNGDPYGIPSDNPFANDAGTAPEIWDFGMRNPWRFSFDRETGDLFIGDVGQSAQEEIDAEPAGQGGRNYGWNIMEGDRCYGSSTCDQTGLTLPVFVNDRARGECAIVGGYVYRGEQFPELRGTYVFSDNCSPTLWTLDAATAIATGHADAFQVGTAGDATSSFGEDEAGELYVVTLRGEVYRLVAAAN